MNTEERLAYARGYNAAVAGRWPQHKMPVPPDKVLAEYMRSAKELRDAVDSALATFSPDDELQTELGPSVDAFDAAFTMLRDWLTAKEDIG